MAAILFPASHALFIIHDNCPGQAGNVTINRKTGRAVQKIAKGPGDWKIFHGSVVPVRPPQTKRHHAMRNCSKLLATVVREKTEGKEEKRAGLFSFELAWKTDTYAEKAALKGIARPRYAYFGQPDALWLLIVV